MAEENQNAYVAAKANKTFVTNIRDKVFNAATDVYEIAVVGTEYVSPVQHGGIYGTIYRKYHGAILTTEVIAAVGVAKLVSYAGSMGTTLMYSGETDDGTISISAALGTDEIVYTIAGTTVDAGWVDYTKA